MGARSGRSVVVAGLAAVATVVYCLPARSQSDIEAIDKRIFREIREHNRIMKNLGYLSDTIGPRLTGSDQLISAENWVSGLGRQYEMENVHSEGWTIAHSWQRGSAQARIVSPVSRDLTIASAGWTPGTAGQVRGKVVYVSAQNLDELRAYRGKLKGRIVISQPPMDLSWQLSAQTAALPGPLIQAPAPVPVSASPSPETDFGLARMAFLREEGAAAILRDSDEGYGLLNM